MDVRVRGWENKPDIYLILPNSEHHRKVGPKLTDFIRCGLLAHFHGDGDFISVHEKYVAVEGDATNFSDFANTYAGNRAGYVELFVIDNTEETKSKAYRRHVNQVQWVYGCESGLTRSL